jgi:hypothetical protein
MSKEIKIRIQGTTYHFSISIGDIAYSVKQHISPTGNFLEIENIKTWCGADEETQQIIKDALTNYHKERE